MKYQGEAVPGDECEMVRYRWSWWGRLIGWLKREPIAVVRIGEGEDEFRPVPVEGHTCDGEGPGAATYGEYVTQHLRLPMGSRSKPQP